MQPGTDESKDEDSSAPDSVDPGHSAADEEKAKKLRKAGLDFLEKAIKQAQMGQDPFAPTAPPSKRAAAVAAATAAAEDLPAQDASAAAAPAAARRSRNECPGSSLSDRPEYRRRRRRSALRRRDDPVRECP